MSAFRLIGPARVKRLSDLLPQTLGPAAARQGFANAEILARWETIVGADIAAVAAPQKLGVPPRTGGTDPDASPSRATLTLRVEGAFALEIQHRSGEIVERVNAHLGWPCVGWIRIRQGAVTRAGTRRRTAPEPSAEDAAAVDRASKAIEDEGLAEAVARLGRAALGASRR